MTALAKPTKALRPAAPTPARAPVPAPARGPAGNQARLRWLQAKLTIGAVDDPLEHEADAVAEQVMRAPDQALSVGVSPPRISRQCAACGDVDKLQAKRGGSDMDGGEAPAAVDAALRTPGRPLDTATREFFEPRFGADFSSVRVRDDDRASDSARQVGARAYTVGQDLVFARGAYAPSEESGRRLIAHELTHVLQQGQGGSGDVRRDTPKTNPNPNPNPDPMPDPKAPDPDPDATCMGCTPVARVTKMNAGVKTVIGLCDNTFDSFNTGGGSVISPPCTPIASNNVGFINFGAGPSGKPAWQTAAHIKDCTTPPPAGNAPTPWEIGFIQSVEKATYGAAYDNGNFVAVTVANARDALNAQTPAPWYDVAGGNFGPQVYPTVPLINDTPNTKVRITHDDTGDKDLLKSVCLKAKFNIWLIINRKGATPTAGNVDFLYHWTIDTDQKFILGAGAHPCNTSQWMPLGTQAMSNTGPGKGSATPIFGGATANSLSKRDTKIKTDPCATTVQPQTPPPQNPPQNPAPQNPVPQTPPKTPQ